MFRTQDDESELTLFSDLVKNFKISQKLAKNFKISQNFEN